MSQNNSILFITSFRDIGRDNWSAFRRGANEYVQRFHTLVENMKYPIVAYVDAKTRPKVKQMSNLTIVEMEKVTSFVEKYEAIEQAIIDSEKYKSMIPSNRKHHPEHLYAAYNLANHSKINYIKDAMETYPEYTHYAWIDFGCVTDLSVVPCNVDMGKLEEKRIMNHYMKMPTAPARSPQEMLTTFDVYVPGGMFIVPKSLVATYELLYERELQYWHSIGISDDDQGLVYQLMLKNPDMFLSLPANGEWSVLFKKHLNRPFEISSLRDAVRNELFDAMNKYGSCREESVCKIYEGIYSSKRQSVKNVFELGVGSRNTSIKCHGGEPGGCLRAWRDYFPSASVYGADIDRESLISEERIKTMYCNKLNGTHNLGAIANVEFDLVADSAGGSLDSSLRFMDAVIGKLSRNGVYAVEGLSVDDVALCRDKVNELSSRYPFQFVVHKNLLLALPRV
jgi:hypothetical protein